MQLYIATMVKFINDYGDQSAASFLDLLSTPDCG